MGRKVKITKAGYQSGTVAFGHIGFTDGVSNEVLSEREISWLGGLIPISDADSGDQVGGTSDLVKLTKMSAEISKSLKEQEADRNEEIAAERRKQEKLAAVKMQFLAEYQLQEIADRRGLIGLREVGEAYGVKGKEIKTMIAKILQAQEKYAKDQEKIISKEVDAQIKKEDKVSKQAHAVAVQSENDDKATEEAKVAAKDNETTTKEKAKVQAKRQVVLDERDSMENQDQADLRASEEVAESVEKQKSE